MPRGNSPRAWALLLPLLLAPAPREQAGDPVVRRFDLERYFYATPEAAARDQGALAGLLDRLDRTRGRLAGSSSLLARALILDDSVSRLTTRLTYYYHLRAYRDSRDAASGHLEDSLWATVDDRRAWLDSELGRIPKASAARWMSADSRLGRFQYAIEHARESVPSGSAATNQVSGQLAPYITGWQFPLWQRLPPDARAAKAAIVLETVRARTLLARTRGFPSAPAETYAERGLTVEGVKSLIGRVRGAAELYRKYLAIRGRPAPSDPPFTAPFDSVAPWMRRALRPFGPAYLAELDALYDPATSRLDIGGDSARRSGGFSFIAPGAATGVYLDSYGGRLSDLSRLVHESGHALHRSLMDHAGVPQTYRYGPLLMEPVALFNELLVADDLYRNARTPATRRHALEQFLNKALEVFHGAQDAELEQAIYDAVAAGGLDRPESLDSLTAAVDQAYLPAGAPNDGSRWARTRLLVEDPLYLSNYLYSGLFALAFYSAAIADPDEFGPRYLAFLRGGFDGPPLELVKARLSIDLGSPSLLQRGLEMLEQRIEAYEALRR